MIGGGMQPNLQAPTEQEGVCAQRGERGPHGQSYDQASAL